MTRETSMWAWLRRAHEKWPSALHLQRVENAIAEGTPDVEGCLSGQSFWIEMKSCPMPKRALTPIRPRFRPAQVPWLRRRWAAGGCALLLLQVGSARAAKRYLLEPEEAALLADVGGTREWLAEESLLGISGAAMEPWHVIEAAADAAHKRSLRFG